jgi:hypothetical protein
VAARAQVAEHIEGVDEVSDGAHESVGKTDDGAGGILGFPEKPSTPERRK